MDGLTVTYPVKQVEFKDDVDAKWTLRCDAGYCEIERDRDSKSLFVPTASVPMLREALRIAAGSEADKPEPQPQATDVDNLYPWRVGYINRDGDTMLCHSNPDDTSFVTYMECRKRCLEFIENYIGAFYYPVYVKGKK